MNSKPYQNRELKHSVHVCMYACVLFRYLLSFFVKKKKQMP